MLEIVDCNNSILLERVHHHLKLKDFDGINYNVVAISSTSPLGHFVSKIENLPN